MVDTLVILVIGAVVGVMPGLFGVGGGFLSIPALHMFAGVDMTLAVGIAMAQALGPTTTGVLHRWAEGKLYVRTALVMLGGSQIGLHLGLAFLDWVQAPREAWIFRGRPINAAEAFVLALYVAILLFIAALTAWEYRRSRHRGTEANRGWLDALRIPPWVELPEVDGRRLSLPLLCVLAVVVGFLNGGLGVGGAILMVPSLVFLFGVPTHRAVTVTLALGLFNGALATFAHAWRGNMDLKIACLLLIGGAVGSQLGSRINDRLSGRSLRGYFSLLILAAALVLTLQLARLLYGAN